MRSKDIALYMDFAKRVSLMSYCDRKKVGAIVVDKAGTNVISMGYNGTPSGFPNDCECNGKTHPHVLHAEQNALMKLAASHQSSDGGSIFVTLSPCETCSVLIIQSGIKKVFFNERYRVDNGLKLLAQSGIEVTHLVDTECGYKESPLLFSAF